MRWHDMTFVTVVEDPCKVSLMYLFDNEYHWLEMEANRFVAEDVAFDVGSICVRRSDRALQENG